MIPFNKPFIVGKELYNIACAVVQNGHLAGDGPYTKQCHELLGKMLGCKSVLLTHSCTGALEMAAILADVGPGDEVIMPSFTFVTTANAFVLRGATPVFVDIRPDTLNIDESLIEQAVTERTKAIVPVHYGGRACNMKAIMDIAERHDLIVIEDAAQSLMSFDGDRPLGTIGHFGCLSFHETKNVISGEGGALIINDDRFLDRAEIIREKGTNRSQFFRGQVDKYTWVDIGSSYLPSELTAAFLHAQLENAEAIDAKRRELFQVYSEELADLADRGAIVAPDADACHECNGHLYFIILKSLEERTELIRFLAEREIKAVFHYVPLHSSPAGQRYGRAFGDLNVTDQVSDTLLRLPLYYDMEKDDVREVAAAIRDFFA
ncbi:dTDP-4-amino-4,6-dideoxygalactose transaminase [Desulfovibrio oxyclinae]|jgi:dTDP-4-amino-4,6-dideoxygalactose transaminase|uniref:dTDP-4-amino-4,6-dideoxygalactose transaminase n=1 Tax=Desulfovibrio oxyclinae TaxID=63560 RepID=UPI00036040E9|nr:dTDP-4-amino-4,6-dideoxygalactose transaminase [Desulfovibrio oxyclinae]